MNISDKNYKIIQDATLVFLLALGFRLIFGLAKSTMTTDEIEFVRPTIERFLNGEFPIFLHNNTYMGTIEPLLGSLIYRLTENWNLSLRLPIIMFDALGVALLFSILRFGISRKIALCVALLLSFPNSSIFEVIYNNHPGYGLGRVVVSLTIVLSMIIRPRLTQLNILLFGIAAGILTYLFPQNILQFGACSLWLALNSPDFKILSQKFKNLCNSKNYQCLLHLLFLGIGMVALLLLSYHYLSRPGSFRMAMVDWFLLVVSCVFLTAGALWFLIHLRPQGSNFLLIGLLAFGYIVGNKPFYFLYERLEKPSLELMGANFHAGATYILKNLYYWMDQVVITTDQIIPALLFGFIKEYPGGSQENLEVSVQTAITVLVLLLIMVHLINYWKTKRVAIDLESNLWLFVIPLILTFVIMFPSWRLTSAYSLRYLGTFVTGLYLIFYYLLKTVWKEKHADCLFMKITCFLVLLAIFDNTLAIKME